MNFVKNVFGGMNVNFYGAFDIFIYFHDAVKMRQTDSKRKKLFSVDEDEQFLSAFDDSIKNVWDIIES
ncbi:CLUMA_CG008029, isoform A [Clunio marinus]|uniref:CLUMA_CG008029, isoform A n=1 Tax=Clunio marinus TaxID=568069 RepID=A0A1J1I6G1_9DIPT|nr:CLUMA_CG008029, isoform A [Clunio marinus]